MIFFFLLHFSVKTLLTRLRRLFQKKTSVLRLIRSVEKQLTVCTIIISSSFEFFIPRKNISKYLPCTRQLSSLRIVFSETIIIAFGYISMIRLNLEPVTHPNRSRHSIKRDPQRIFFLRSRVEKKNGCRPCSSLCRRRAEFNDFFRHNERILDAIFLIFFYKTVY